MVKRSRVVGILWVWGFAASGCFSVNAYQSARAVDPGELSLAGGLSIYAASDDEDAAPVPIPTVAARYGAGAGVDLGATVTALGHLRGDIKFNPLRSEYFDVAIGAAGFAHLFPEGGDSDASLIVGGEGLALVDFKASSSVSIGIWGGPGYLRSGDVGIWYPRLGGGVRIWGDGFWVHPEISTVIDRFTGSPADIAIGIGVGLETRSLP